MALFGANWTDKQDDHEHSLAMGHCARCDGYDDHIPNAATSSFREPYPTPPSNTKPCPQCGKEINNTPKSQRQHNTAKHPSQ